MTIIRLAGLVDLPRIVAIFNQAIASKNAIADTVPFTVEQRLDWFRVHTPDKHPVYARR
jgi:phosphinothricin acetyltransferase